MLPKLEHVRSVARMVDTMPNTTLADKQAHAVAFLAGVAAYSTDPAELWGEWGWTE